VRASSDADLEPIARLFTDSVRALGAARYDAAQLAAWAPEPPDLEAWRARLASLETLVAEADGELLGFLSYTPVGHVELLYTAPASARRGVASALYRAAEDELRARGVRELTTEASLVARPFFERQGYLVVEEQRVERNGQVFRRFAMRKKAGPDNDTGPPTARPRSDAPVDDMRALEQRGRRLVLTVIAVLLATGALGWLATLAGPSPFSPLQHAVRLVLSLTLCAFLYQRAAWARWVTVALYLVSGVLCVHAGAGIVATRVAGLLLIALGLAQLACVGALVLAPSARVWFRAARYSPAPPGGPSTTGEPLE
jgi:putative acetyltransferase